MSYVQKKDGETLVPFQLQLGLGPSVIGTALSWEDAEGMGKANLIAEGMGKANLIPPHSHISDQQHSALESRPMGP